MCGGEDGRGVCDTWLVLLVGVGGAIWCCVSVAMSCCCCCDVVRPFVWWWWPLMGDECCGCADIGWPLDDGVMWPLTWWWAVNGGGKDGWPGCGGPNVAVSIIVLWYEAMLINILEKVASFLNQRKIYIILDYYSQSYRKLDRNYYYFSNNYLILLTVILMSLGYSLDILSYTKHVTKT